MIPPPLLPSPQGLPSSGNSQHPPHSHLVAPWLCVPCDPYGSHSRGPLLHQDSRSIALYTCNATRSYPPFSESSSAHSTKPSPPSSSRTKRSVLPPRPLFFPTTLTGRDSIIRNIPFFNAATHCFPGATVTLVTNCQGIIVHLGINDTALQQYELIKKNIYTS